MSESRSTEARRSTTRDRLIERTRELVAEQTPQEVSLRAVAAGCGMTVAAVYTYFQSRADLMAATAERTLADLNDAIDAATGDRSDADAIPALALAVIDFARARPGEFRLMSEALLGGWGRRSEAADLYMARLHEIVAAAGFGRNDPARHEVVVFGVTALIQGLVLVAHTSGGRPDAGAEVMGHVVRALVRGLAREEPPRPSAAEGEERSGS